MNDSFHNSSVVWIMIVILNDNNLVKDPYKYK